MLQLTYPAETWLSAPVTFQLADHSGNAEAMLAPVLLLFWVQHYLRRIVKWTVVFLSNLSSLLETNSQAPEVAQVINIVADSEILFSLPADAFKSHYCPHFGSDKSYNL